jgi:hypothetical protein
MACSALNLDVHRVGSMAADVQQGYNLPNPAAIRSVGLDIVEIWKGLREIRKGAVSYEHNKYFKRTKPIKGNNCILFYRRGDNFRWSTSHSKSFPALFEPLLE